jgi:L-ascorbate metabolism protein UlaG (beta-lactamase superfamily)
MEINWLGNSCFRIKGKQATVITDPLQTENGCSLNRLTADVVCVSPRGVATVTAELMGGNPYIISGPGEYEVCNTLIIGIPTYQDDSKGSVRGKNTIYALELDEISICHLGRLGHLLTDQQIEELGSVDVLLLPVGGNVTINASQAARLVRNIEPKIVIPMHYKTAGSLPELDPVEKFLSETGKQGLMPQPKLNVSKNSLPLTTEIVLLDCPV